jgi:HEAT repeat protein
MEKKEIDKLIKTLGSTGFFGASYEERRAAVDKLRGFTKVLKEEPRAVPALIKALKDRDLVVRVFSANLLGKIGDSSAISSLIEYGDRYNNEKLTSAIAIAEIGDPIAAPTLIKALEDCESFDSRGNAANALGKIGDPSAIPALIKALEDRSGIGAETVRLCAAGALGEIGDPSAIPALKKALMDGNIYVRGHAAGALGKIGDPSAIPALKKALMDGDIFVRGHAADALEKLGAPRALPDLINALETGDGGVGTEAANALGYIKDPSAIPYLIKALGSGGLNVREAAAKALGEMNDISALKALEYLMKNDSEECVRKAAFKASAKIRSSRGILEEEPTHKISAGGDIMIDSAKFSTTFSDSSTKISDVGMIKGNVGGKKEVPFSKCPYCGAELNLLKTPKFCPYCGDQLRE